MKLPAGLQVRGKALWKSIVEGLPEGWEFDDRELAIITMAARQADDLNRLEGEIQKHGAMVVGSQGQPVLNPAVAEARQARLATSRLLGSLSLPDAEQEPRTVAGLRGQRAAQSRWGRQDRLRAQRERLSGA